jgi:HAE1 family hydrophobic/amphiphilic exporter-1
VADGPPSSEEPRHAEQTPQLAHRGARRFFEVLVRHPVGVLMLTVALLGMALIAAARIPIELVPAGLTDNSLFVNAPWPGAIPSEVEKRVVEPLEKELLTVPGVESVYSRAEAGGAGIVLRFPGDVDMKQAQAEVMDRIERARPKLPEEVDRVRIFKSDPSALPIMMAAVVAPEGLSDEQQQERTQTMVIDEIIPRLEAVDGVARVSAWGVEPISVRILLDRERVRADRVDLRDVVARLSNDNLSAPAGDIDDAGERYLVRVDSRFRSLQEIEDFPVREGLRLGDIGRVIEVRSAPDYLFRVGGRYTVGFQVVKETSANTFDVSDRVRRVIEEEFRDDAVLGPYAFSIFFNQGELIGQSLRELVRDAALGGLIACMVLWLFLRRLSYTLLITLSIPFAVLLTMAWLYFSGGSLNLMTMVGITISIGMLVDNSVVIVESIFTRRERGADRLTAVTEGPAEVLLAIVTATLTTVVVFLPLIFLTEDRNARVIASAIGMPLCIALLAALLLAVVMVPVASRYLQHRGQRTAGAARTAGHLPGWLRRPLDGATAWTGRHRYTASAFALLILASGQLAASGSEFVVQGNQGGQIQVDLDFSSGTRLIDAHREVLAIEQTLADQGFDEAFPELDWGVGFSERGGDLNLWPERPLRKGEKEDLFAWLKDRLPKRSAVEYRFGDDFDAAAERETEWTGVRIEGPDSVVVAALVEEVRQRALADPRVLEISKEDRETPEVRVSLDRQRMGLLGVTGAEVTQNLEWTLRGFMVSRFAQPNQDLPILIEYDRSDPPDRVTLEESMIWSAGGVVPLSTIAEFATARAPERLVRRDGRISRSIGLKTDTEDAKEAYRIAWDLVHDLDMPEGYRWTQDGGWTELQQQQQEMKNAGLLAVTLVFLLMGLLFNSLVLPLSVLTTVPFAMLGSLWALSLADVPIGIMEMIGFIVLAGVVVNNGIVLIDRILRLRAGGLERAAAVRQAVQDRARPVVMTALTTVCGLAPIALSEPSGQSISFQGLAVGVIGGIVVATFFTLWAVPLFYTLFEDLGALCTRWATGRAPRGTTAQD